MSGRESSKRRQETLYEKLTGARAVLGIGEEANLETIKKAFHDRIRTWHPDKCREKTEECQRKTAELLEAYRLVSDYCSHYVFSFRQTEVERHAPYEELWNRLYGHDPMWGAPD
ncbi:MAG: J domain-containing protein [Chitinispirillaceae bacterium]|nr:J domain-containing protein [Chitinispirillaceae bacterium]